MDDEKLRQANQLKSLLDSHSFKTTIGAWLEEMRENAITLIAQVPHGDSAIWGIQAELRVLDKIFSRIDSILEAGERIRLKLLKDKKESVNE